MWDEEELQLEKDFALKEEANTGSFTGQFSKISTTIVTKEPKIVEKTKEENEKISEEKKKTTPNKKMFTSQNKPRPGSLSREKNENATVKVHGAKYSFPVHTTDSPGLSIETPTPETLKIK
jgi:hypothetical protein